MLKRAAANQVKAEIVDPERLLGPFAIASLLRLLPSQPCQRCMMVNRDPHGVLHHPSSPITWLAVPRELVIHLWTEACQTKTSAAQAPLRLMAESRKSHRR